MWIPKFPLRPGDLCGSAPYPDAYGNTQSGSSDRFSIPERRGPAYRSSHHVLGFSLFSACTHNTEIGFDGSPIWRFGYRR